MKRLLLQNRMTTGLVILCGLLALIVLAEISWLDTTDIDFDPAAASDSIELPADAKGRFIPKSLAYFTEIILETALSPSSRRR